MLRMFLFGTPRIEYNGQAVPLRRTKALALLAYLIVTRQPCDRDGLIGLLWPEFDQTSARNNLRRELSLLKAALNDEFLIADRLQVAWNPQVEYWLDVAVFQEHIANMRQHRHESGEICAACAAGLTAAVQLATTEFLAGFNLPDSPAFEEWLFFQREELRQQLADLLQALARRHRAQGDFGVALGYARRWLALDPLHEPAQRALMRLYAWAGQPAAALRQYQESVRLLETQLGVEPETATTELYEAIRTRQFAVQPRASAPSGDAETLHAADLLNSPQPTPASLTLVRPQTRYVASGDVHIAYQVIGEGPIDIIFVSGFISHLELIWEDPGLARFLRRLSTMARLILFDKRGVGLSDRVGYPPTLEDTIDDMLAVMDAVGARRPVLFGVSEGGPNSMLFAAHHPARLAGLILYGTAARSTYAPDYPWAPTSEQFDTWLDRLIAGWGGAIGLEYFAPTRADDLQFRDWWARMLRLGSSPGSIKAVLEVERVIDMRGILSSIDIPTLVLHRADDRVTRVQGGRYLGQHIPGAAYVELAGADHWWWVGNTDSLLAQVATFLRHTLATSNRSVYTA